MRLLATVGSQPSSWAATAQPPKQLRAKDPNQWAPLTIKMQTAASQHDSATFYLKGRPRTVSQASGSSKSRQQEYAVHHATGDVFHYISYCIIPLYLYVYIHIYIYIYIYIHICVLTLKKCPRNMLS